MLRKQRRWQSVITVDQVYRFAFSSFSELLSLSLFRREAAMSPEKLNSRSTAEDDVNVREVLYLMIKCPYKRLYSLLTASEIPFHIGLDRQLQRVKHLYKFIIKIWGKLI